MESGQEFDVVLRKKKWRAFPKKLLCTKKIQITDRYSFNATIWIADTPNCNMKPTVNLTLQHNHSTTRFCFEGAAQMVLALADLHYWVNEMGVKLHISHAEAVREFLAFHEGSRPDISDGYTLDTVIQEIVRKRLKRKNTRSDSEARRALKVSTLSTELEEKLDDRFS